IRHRSTVLILTPALAFLAKTATFAQGKDHFLDLKRECDEPLPLYKSFSEILLENWWIWATLAGSALLAGFVYWLPRHLHKGQGKEELLSLRDPYEEAIEALEVLAAERDRIEAKPFVFRLSEILRIYVEQCFAVPAMEQTGEEFLREVAEHKFFRNRYDDLLHDFIDRSDMVKYSQESIDSEGIRLLLDSATHFVKDTHSRLEEERAHAESRPDKEAA
ncbi:MAG: hypothetical protein VB997_03695, partial [Opitutales bacterium]